MNAKKTQQADHSKTPLLKFKKKVIHTNILLVHNSIKTCLGHPSSHLRSTKEHRLDTRGADTTGVFENKLQTEGNLTSGLWRKAFSPLSVFI